MPSSRPESVEGAALLDRISTFLSRFVVLSDSQKVELSLWVVHTYAFGAATATPYQNIYSAEMESGKTRLLEVLELLVARPWLTGRVSAAALVREIDNYHPTLLLDEGDAAFGRDKEYFEALREVLNMGHRRGGKATICVGQGPNIATKRFDVFCPKAIAGIGRLPDTVAGRSVPIRLKRKAGDEQVERFRRRLVEGETDKLRQLLAEWAKANIEQLGNAWPLLPDALTDRQQDGAEPLLAIADLAGDGWPRRAREALVELFHRGEARHDSIRTRLLSDIRAVLESNCSDRISTMDLLCALAEIETAPWAEFSHGRALTPTALSRLLKPFDIAPKDIRIGDRILKGYERECFGEAWTRYLPPLAPTLPDEAQHAQQTAINAPMNDTGKGQRSLFVAPHINAESPTTIGTVADVAAIMSPRWEELGLSVGRPAKVNSTGVARCPIHRANLTDWWSRGNDMVCGRCHPGPP
jgi:Protein of unknown function (DUF3631)